MERLLNYSLERKSPIRMIYMQDGEFVQRNVLVEEIGDSSISVYIPQRRKHFTILKSDILSVDFRKNDEALK